MDKFSLHTHTNYCDGKSSIRSLIERAISLEMSAIGFSSHAPLSIDVDWAMCDIEVGMYAEEILLMKEEYASQIEIFLSLEIDYIPGYTLDFEGWKQDYELDYTIGSIHIVKSENDELWFLDGPLSNYDNGILNIFDGNAQKAVECYYRQLMEMITTQKPDIVGHIDKIIMNNKGRYFSGEEKWYVDLLDELIGVLKVNKSIIEVNTRGIYTGKCDFTFPNTKFITKCVNAGIPLTVSTDAHHVDQLLLEFDNTCKLLSDLKCKNIVRFSNGAWKKVYLDI